MEKYGNIQKNMEIDGNILKNIERYSTILRNVRKMNNIENNGKYWPPQVSLGLSRPLLRLLISYSAEAERSRFSMLRSRATTTR